MSIGSVGVVPPELRLNRSPPELNVHPLLCDTLYGYVYNISYRWQVPLALYKCHAVSYDELVHCDSGGLFKHVNYEYYITR